MTRHNKLEGLPLETLTSQVLVFEGKARADPIGGSFRCSFLGKLLVLPTNSIWLASDFLRQDFQKVLHVDKPMSY
jgi:hypothetical protein